MSSNELSDKSFSGVQDEISNVSLLSEPLSSCTPFRIQAMI